MGEVVIPVKIEEEMKRSYIDYAMSVIVGRALPDVRDGLKPVHRRILYAMYEMGMFHNKPYKKSARVVGEVLGKYHPHGDQAVYDALVRMVQDFSMRYPLVDGQGNFGSVDGDSPAAMRYTEVRLAKIAEELLADIDKNTIDFVPNFDESLVEPSVLPAKLPNLLINGSSGIAVGMATNMPPHNLGEVVDAIIKVIDSPEVTIKELLNYIKGPDFPTGGYILGKEEIKKAYITGRGIITLRGKVELEEGRIIITELPYQVNKSKLVEEIANCVKTKKIEGISDLRDESDREGIRVVIELNSHANQEIILNQLYKYTQLETTFGIINLALVDGEPRILSLKGLIEEYIKHRRNIITRRTKFELEKSEKRKHIVEGLLIALKNIDEVIETIKKSENVEEARNKLISRFNLTKIQAQAILDMRLQKLTALETEKLEQENKELEDKISYLKEVLASEQKVLEIIKKELLELKEKYADERRTKIIPKPTEVKEEDLIPEEEMVVILTGEGYIKRIPLNAYRSQRRGGRGIVGIDTKEKDIVTNIIISSTHDILLFFSNKGKVYAKKVYEIPVASRYSRGKALVNVFEISKDERITAVLPMEFGKGYLFMATKKGKVKKTSMDEFLSIRKTGKIAIELEEEDELVEVKVTSGDDEILLATKFGKAIRFPEREVRAMGRATLGVKGISLVNGDEVVGIEVLNSENLEQTFLVVTENGYGKRSKFAEFPLQGRGGKGVITIKISQKTGLVAGVEGVGDEDEIIISSMQGIMIRLRVKEIPILGRNTQGVKLMRLENDKVATVVKVV